MPGCAASCTAVGDELRVLILGEPIAKERPRMNRKTGNVYTPKATKDAERATAWAMRQVRGRRPMFRGEVDVELFFGLGGQRRKADVDNLAKLCLDAASGVLFTDDRQVARLVVLLRRFDPKPRTVMVVRPYPAVANPAMVGTPTQGGTQ